MTTQALAIVHSYIRRYIKITGHTPTAEHLSLLFEKPVEAMRLALASYPAAQS